ncbi:metallophosphoesterase family protein [Asticcacaulis taihuensis]|uniref:Serine/threonine protein phosphatase 1 n=1 Tax=Asticcacaulis taihuensis TaxID=260084 RepID=A0A1G4QE07_9CAUL|nr:metallophosphoesterase family protein [Asticcacaulis taihuensis]SCW42359.1 serine/threonine protein phosphatase 1 [Asticcacaulis taihuensis]
MTSRIAQLTYAIGDIHGYDDLFERMIDHIRADAEGLGERPRIVLLGDYVDRGPASRQVLDRVGRLLAADWCDVVALMGNHEEALLRFLDEPEFGDTWRDWGGAATLDSYGVVMPYMARSMEIWDEVSRRFAAKVDPAHLEMLRAMPSSFQAGDYLFVHAGVDPDRPLAEQDSATFMYIRGRFLRADQACDYVVVHGHSPHKVPANTRWRIGIDTGVYYSGVLTAMRLRGEERELIQVQQEMDLDRAPPVFF